MAQVYEGYVSVVDFLQQLDTTNEVKIPDSGIVQVQTHNSLYEYDIDNGVVRGGVLGDEWIKGRFQGTTFGGSMIKIGYVIPGSFLEFVALDTSDGSRNFYKTWTSSVIQRVTVLEKIHAHEED